jgi:hypothetical protein
MRPLRTSARASWIGDAGLTTASRSALDIASQLSVSLPDGGGRTPVIDCNADRAACSILPDGTASTGRASAADGAFMHALL